MKKTLFLVSGLLLGASAFGSDLAQLTLSISTQGPDYYADGQQLQVGETYLLVYVKKDASFQGLFTDGTLVDPVNNKIATTGAAIEGARCGFKALQYPADLYPADGSWVVVALDTRTSAGAVGGLVAGLGSSSAAPTGAATSLNALNVAAQNNGVPTLATTASTQTSAATPVPEITAVDPNGASVDVSFKNVSASALYEVQSTTDLAAGVWQATAVSTLGQAPATRLQATPLNTVGEGSAAEVRAAVQVPEADKVRFFRVIGR